MSGPEIIVTAVVLGFTLVISIFKTVTMYQSQVRREAEWRKRNGYK